VKSEKASAKATRLLGFHAYVFVYCAYGRFYANRFILYFMHSTCTHHRFILYFMHLTCIYHKSDILTIYK